MGIDVYGEPKRAIAGEKYGMDDICETLIARENIDPGDPVFGMKGQKQACYKAHLNAVSLAASKDLVAGDSVAVTINGITVENVDFINSSEDTIKAIVQAIDLNDDVRALGIDAFQMDGVANTIFLSAPGVTITASAVVTGSGTPATFTSTADTDMVFLGVARHEELSYREGTGFYPAFQPVSVMPYGQIYVPVTDDSSPVEYEKAYIVLSGADAGKFTDVATNNLDCGAVFRSDKQDGLARVELSGIKGR
jgi:hypothetical protein